ncbi:MAG: DUF2505 domain-containing protein [Candidatus Nanopelagicales bacterium]|jgi:hypothetical protein|nr:DUF2505 domain-containing protein [Candidatus Nanopelagicales bacterium]
MAKRYDGAMHFDAAPDVVFAAQSDATYVVWKHEHMASFDVSAEVAEDGQGWTISSSRKLPAQIPAAAKRFVGEHIQVDEVHRWGHPELDGTRHGTVTASFGGAPMAVEGTLLLRPDGMGSVLEVVIHSRASVPLVGGKLEAVVGEQFMRALRKEQQIAPEWFGASPGA